MKTLHSRKGVLILSDMMWLLIYILSVFIVFIFLFYPLHKDIMKDKMKVATEQTQLHSDAQFYALVIPALPLHIDATATAQAVDTTTTIYLQTALNLNVKDGKIDNSDGTLYHVTDPYHAALSEYFGSEEFSQVTENNDKPLQEFVLARMRSYLIYDGIPVDGWACEYYYDGNQPQCGSVGLSTRDYEDTEGFYEEYDNDEEGYADLGWVTIPTEQGPLTIEVVAIYEARS